MSLTLSRVLWQKPFEILAPYSRNLPRRSTFHLPPHLATRCHSIRFDFDFDSIRCDALRCDASWRDCEFFFGPTNVVRFNAILSDSVRFWANQCLTKPQGEVKNAAGEMCQEKLQKEKVLKKKNIKKKVFHYADIEKVHTGTTRDDNGPIAGTVIQTALRVKCLNEWLNEWRIIWC